MVTTIANKDEGASVSVMDSVLLFMFVTRSKTKLLGKLARLTSLQ